MIGSEDNEEFEVDKIVAQRLNPEDIIEYKIRWKGFSSDYDTWEPEVNLIGCEEVLKEFKLNNCSMENPNKDMEDGEVSGTDSSGSNDILHRKAKRSSKGKKRKSKKKANAKIKSETSRSSDPLSFNEDLGIKVELFVDHTPPKDKLVPKSVSSTFTPNFSMGASELLLNFHSHSLPTFSIDSIPSTDYVKSEIVDLTEESVHVKPERSFFPFETQSPQSENNGPSDSDSDLETELKVVINEEPDKTSVDNEIGSQNEKTRSWRDQLDTGNFKIRKSQRKSPHNQMDESEGTPVLGKDKWTNVKIKDNQTEAFYNLAVLQSLQETRLRADKELTALRNMATVATKDELVRAIEEGNVGPVWNTLQCKDTQGAFTLNDGELLILASRLGFCDIIGMIIRAGVDVNYQNDEGITPLMSACEYGHELACHVLIMNGAHINVVNKKSESALTKVVTRGHKECLVVLLQYGCDIFSLDSEKGPLQIAHQRNLHEMEAIITDYHKKLSDTLTNRSMGLLGALVTISYVLFPLRVVSLFEEKEFVLDFQTKIPPVKEDECNLLMMYTGFVHNKQIRFCFEQTTPIKSVVLNDIDQQCLVPDDANYIMSMAPILDGKNVLTVRCESVVQSRWVRLLIIGFRVKINTNKTG